MLLSATPDGLGSTLAPESMHVRVRTSVSVGIVCLALIALLVSVEKQDRVVVGGATTETAEKPVLTFVEPPIYAPPMREEAEAPASLKEDTSLAFSETVWLSQLLERKRIAIDATAQQAVAETIAGFQQVRRDYEAHICEVVPVNADRVEITVPAYSEVGDAMQRLFAAELEERVGPELAHRILRELDSSIEEELGYFGHTTQHLEFSRDPGSAPRTYLASVTTDRVNVAGASSSQPRLTYIGPDIADSDGLQAFLPKLQGVSTL